MADILGAPVATGSEKRKLTLVIRNIDNGYILEATKGSPNYERVELSFPTLPKLLKAVGTFLREGEDED